MGCTYTNETCDGIFYFFENMYINRFILFAYRIFHIKSQVYWVLCKILKYQTFPSIHFWCVYVLKYYFTYTKLTFLKIQFKITVNKILIFSSIPPEIPVKIIFRRFVINVIINYVFDISWTIFFLQKQYDIPWHVAL